MANSSWWTVKWAVVVVAMFSLTSANYALADAPLDDYVKGFSGQLDREQTALRDLVRTYNSLDFNNRSSLATFQSELRNHRKVFEDSVGTFKSLPPSGAPSTLLEARRLALAASESLSNGVDVLDRAISSRDQRSMTRAENLMNEGKDKLNSAVDAYNSFVDESNRRRQSPSSASLEPGLGATFGATLTYGPPLAYAYLYLLVAGLLLSWYFRVKLKRLTSGELKPFNFRGSGIYGLHLVALFPYLYALLAFSLLLLLDFTLVSVSLLSSVKRIPIGLVFGLFIVIAGSLWGILRGFLGGAKRRTFGVPCTRAEHPRVWALSDAVAVEVGTKPVDKIFLSPQPGIGVHLEGGLFSLLAGRTKRVLTIGVGSIIGLSISEMRAILAHEFGHFSNRDTAWNSLTFTMASALHNALSTMPSPWRPIGSGWVRLISGLNPALWTMMAYRLVFALVTMGFSRVREVLADKTAISLYGYPSFTGGLMKVARNDELISRQVVPEMARMLTEDNQAFVNVFQTLEERCASLSTAEASSMEASLLGREKRSVFDTHPLLRERMAYASRFEVAAKYPASDDNVKSLFENWNATTKSLSDLYTYYVAALIGHTPEASDSETNASST